MDVSAALVADDETAEAGHSREGAPDDPAVPSETNAVSDTLAGDAKLDAATAEGASDGQFRAGIVSMEHLQSPSRPARLPPLQPSAASSVASNTPLSCRSAPLMLKLSGVPSASVTRWCFVPRLPRSVGFGPFALPPSCGDRRAVERRPVPTNTARCLDPVTQEGDIATKPTPPPPANPAAAASTSCPSGAHLGGQVLPRRAGGSHEHNPRHRRAVQHSGLLPLGFGRSRRSSGSTAAHRSSGTLGFAMLLQRPAPRIGKHS